MIRILILLVWGISALPLSVAAETTLVTGAEYPSMPQPANTDVAPNIDPKIDTGTTAATNEPVVAQPVPDTPQDVVAAVRNELTEQNDRVATGEGAENPITELTREANGRSTGEMLGQMLMSLALVITLALSLAWVMKKFVLKNHTLGGSYIEIMASYAISQKSKVHLIRAGGEHFLIGEGGNSVNLISPVKSLGQQQVEQPSPLIEDPAPLIRETESNENGNGNGNGHEYAAAESTDGSFQDRLSTWQKSLDNQNLSQEVKTSLLMLSGLSERLRRKGGDSHG